MIILDTSVLSALMRRSPDALVVTWLDKQPRTSIWTTSVTVLEVRFGLHSLPAGKRKTALSLNFAELLNKISNRIVPFDAAAAERAGDLIAAGHKRGRPVELRDTMIAGITLIHNATLATGNTKHFQDISAHVVDPWAT